MEATIAHGKGALRGGLYHRIEQYQTDTHPYVWGLPPTTNGSPQHTQGNHTTHSDGSTVRVLIGLCVRAVPLSRATAHPAPCADTDG